MKRSHEEQEQAYPTFCHLPDELVSVIVTFALARDDSESINASVIYLFATCRQLRRLYRRRLRGDIFLHGRYMSRLEACINKENHRLSLRNRILRQQVERGQYESAASYYRPLLVLWVARHGSEAAHIYHWLEEEDSEPAIHCLDALFDSAWILETAQQNRVGLWQRLQHTALLGPRLHHTLSCDGWDEAMRSAAETLYALLWATECGRIFDEIVVTRPDPLLSRLQYNLQLRNGLAWTTRNLDALCTYLIVRHFEDEANSRTPTTLLERIVYRVIRRRLAPTSFIVCDLSTFWIIMRDPAVTVDRVAEAVRQLPFMADQEQWVCDVLCARVVRLWQQRTHFLSDKITRCFGLAQ